MHNWSVDEKTFKAGEVKDTSAAAIEVISGHSEKPITREVLTNLGKEYKTYYLDFNLTKPTVLEFRVEYFQEAPLFVDYIEVDLVS